MEAGIVLFPFGTDNRGGIGRICTFNSSDDRRVGDELASVGLSLGDGKFDGVGVGDRFFISLPVPSDGLTEVSFGVDETDWEDVEPADDCDDGAFGVG